MEYIFDFDESVKITVHANEEECYIVSIEIIDTKKVCGDAETFNAIEAEFLNSWEGIEQIAAERWWNNQGLFTLT